jgi:hypothetical protein
MAATYGASCSPSGLYQWAVQFKAPRYARAAMSGSVASNTPWRMPSAMSERTPRS